MLAFLMATAFSEKAKAIDDTRMLRYPDINNNLIAFTYAGDI